MELISNFGDSEYFKVLQVFCCYLALFCFLVLKHYQGLHWRIWSPCGRGTTKAGQPYVSQFVWASPVQFRPVVLRYLLITLPFTFKSILVWTILYMSVIRHRLNISCHLKSICSQFKDQTGAVKGAGRRTEEQKKVVNRTGSTYMKGVAIKSLDCIATH